MKGTDIQELRKAAKMTREQLAHEMHITSRTLSKWEGKDGRIPTAYVAAAREALGFEAAVCKVLQQAADEVFEGGWKAQGADVAAPAIASELTAIWLVLDGKVHLVRNSARFQCLCFEPGERDRCKYSRTVGCCSAPAGDRRPARCFRNDEVVKTLDQRSLTTYPLNTGETINLAGDSILDHEYKMLQTRTNPHMHGGVCESLLHVPLLLPSKLGPRPITLLSLENKLERTPEGRWHVSEYPDGGQGGPIRAYTPEDEHWARLKLRELLRRGEADRPAGELWQVLCVFGYLDEQEMRF